MRNQKIIHCLTVNSNVYTEIVDTFAQATMVEMTVTQLEEIITLIVANRDMPDRTALK
jgi:hypothetical protein